MTIDNGGGDYGGVVAMFGGGSIVNKYSCGVESCVV